MLSYYVGDSLKPESCCIILILQKLHVIAYAITWNIIQKHFCPNIKRRCAFFLLGKIILEGFPEFSFCSYIIDRSWKAICYNNWHWKRYIFRCLTIREVQNWIQGNPPEQFLPEHKKAHRLFYARAKIALDDVSWNSGCYSMKPLQNKNDTSSFSLQSTQTK